MEELSFSTLIAVFEEMFGRNLFWLLLAAALIVTLAYIYVLIRDRAVSWRKFLWAQVSMPFGAVAAVAAVLADLAAAALAAVGSVQDKKLP